MAAKSNIVLAAVSAVFAVYATPFEIGEALLDAAFWKSSPAEFVEAHHEHGFTFSDASKSGADSNLDGGVVCFGLPVYESRVAFASNGAGISRVELMLYAAAGTEKYLVALDKKKQWRKFNRERVEKSITLAELNEAVDVVGAKIAPEGAKPQQPVRGRTEGGDETSLSKRWTRKDVPVSAVLAWRYSGGRKTGAFKAHFMRLSVENQGLQTGGAKSAKSERSKTVADNVVRDRDEPGDVLIPNVPMVDQGSKGYCAAATSERVLRYYGVNVDEHEIAQAAGTTAEGGTSTRGMKDSVTAVGKRYKLATVVAYGDFEKPMGERIAGIVKEAANYNKAAKRLKKKEIPESVYISHRGNTIYYDAEALDAAMEPEVLLYMKVNGPQKSKFKKFLADVRQQIGKGIPLFWGLTLGVFPEENVPQERGGHMRLIIGYNDKRGEILYSDSWGEGHELKRIAADKAFTVSHCLMYMKPLK